MSGGIPDEIPTFAGAYQRDEDPMIAEVEREFASNNGDSVDRAGALDHAKAMTILAASQKTITADSYASALNAVSSETARRTSDDELSERLRGAEALSDAAEARLWERGDRPSASGYEARFIAEVAQVSREFNLPYYPGA